MKLSFAVLALTLSFHSMAHTVIDSLYETKEVVEPIHLSVEREPSSQTGLHCLVDSRERVFGENCYTSAELCEKRLAFWKDLPGAELSNCVKM